MHYYFVGSLLRDLSLNEKPFLFYHEVLSVLKNNLTEKDFQLVKELQSYKDLLNLRNLWIDLPIDQRGNFNKQELEEALIFHEGFSEYVFSFIKRYPDNREKVKNFSYLLTEFFLEKNGLKGFLGKYFQFEREYAVVTSVLRAREWNKDIHEELRFEDQKDFMVSYYLSQKGAKTIDVKREYQPLKNIFERHKLKPRKLQRALFKYRFHAVDEMKDSGFSMNGILAYLVRLMMLEDEMGLNKEQGKQLIDTLI